MPNVSKALPMKVTNPSNLGIQTDGQPYLPDLITSGDERRAKGIGLLYVDDYNANLQNQYNNAYNYWLWQKQMEYNSPKAQVDRLVAAGLNPNFNSIEGTGNATSIPAAEGRLPGKIAQNAFSRVGTALSAASTVASLVSSGVSSLSKFAGIPAGIRAYRKILRGISEGKLERNSLDNALKELNLEGLGVLMGNKVDPDDSRAPHLEGSIWYRGHLANTSLRELQGDILEKQKELLDIREQLMRYDLNVLSPAKLGEITARINYLIQGTGLRIKEMNWKDAKETRQFLVDIIDAIIPG